MKRPWLYYISPCILAAIILLYPIILFLSDMDQDRWVIFIMFLVPTFFILLLVDFVIKALTQGNVSQIWMSESILIAIALIWFTYEFKILNLLTG